MKPMNVVDTVHKSIDNVVSYANTNKEKISKDIVNGVLLFIIFAIFGCFDFVTLSFHFEYLVTAAYWTRTLSKAIAGLCAYHIGINLVWDRELVKDFELEREAKRYERLTKLKDQKTFNEYVVNVFNPKQKKKAYISYINRRLYILNKFARNKDKLLWDSKDDEAKARNRYCRKRKELEMLKSNEYIDNNLDSIKVKYAPVDPIIFELELDAKGTYRGVKVKGNVAAGKAKATASVFIGMLGASAFLSSIGLDANQQQFIDQMSAFWHYLLICCEDVGIILWQVFRGILGTRKLISAELTMPLVGRNMVLTSYIDYCAENHIESSKSYLIYQKIVEGENNERVVEEK